MARWIKYSVIDGQSRDVTPDHVSQMAGYEAGPEYATAESFFAAHLFGVPRCRAYDDYLRSRIGVDDVTLSVASGRCANELYLMQNNGCVIVCSDTEEFPCIKATRTLFPSLTFRSIDVLTDEPEAERYDALISLSLIWAFDDAQIFRFFRFASSALKPKGRLLLDLGGAPDSILAALYHDVWLRIEAHLVALALTLKHRRRFGVAREMHGYRRSVGAVGTIASRAGFTLSDAWAGDHETEPNRSLILAKMPVQIRRILGRFLPYVRMVTLTKNP